MTWTGKGRFARHSAHSLALLLTTVTVACAVTMATVTGPDGNQWQRCEGNDAKCIATIGRQCRTGYVLGYEKQFNCKPGHANDESQCVTDEALEVVSAATGRAHDRPFAAGESTGGPPWDANLNRVRGPDCRMWLMCKGFNDTGNFGNGGCLTSVGRECSHGYVVAEVFGETMYQCASSQDAGQPDAIAPTDSISATGATDSQ